MNIRITNKITEKKVWELCKKKGYWSNELSNKPFNLFIFGVRSCELDQSLDEFNDVLGVIYLDYNKKFNLEIFAITTDPGLMELKNPSFQEAKTGGTAILCEGQYREAYAMGIHGIGNYAHTALVQIKPVSIYRDRNHDNILDLDKNTITTGIYGINIHSAFAYGEAKNILNTSAGCQAFKKKQDLDRLIFLCRKQIEFLSNYNNNYVANKYSYTLFNENDFSII